MEKDMVGGRQVNRIESQPQIGEEWPCREVDGRVVERGRAGALRLCPGQPKIRPDLDLVGRFDLAGLVGENGHPGVLRGFFCDAKGILGVVTGKSFKTLVDYYQSHARSRR